MQRQNVGLRSRQITFIILFSDLHFSLNILPFSFVFRTFNTTNISEFHMRNVFLLDSFLYHLTLKSNIFCVLVPWQSIIQFRFQTKQFSDLISTTTCTQKVIYGETLIFDGQVTQELNSNTIISLGALNTFIPQLIAKEDFYLYMRISICSMRETQGQPV